MLGVVELVLTLFRNVLTITVPGAPYQHERLVVALERAGVYEGIAGPRALQEYPMAASGFT